MADTRTSASEKDQQAVARRAERHDLERRSQGYGTLSDPFQVFGRMAEEMDRTFDRLWRDFGFPQRRESMARNLFGGRGQQDIWAPRIEAFQKDDQFIVRAELPGLKKEDVHVELNEDALTIRGERREEREEKREGYFHSEREYGEFHRTVPLPEGVIGESAQATFRNGILEVSIQAPPSEARRGRTLEITDETGGKP